MIRLSFVTAFLYLSVLGAALAESKSTGVAITESADKVTVNINGELFTEYVFRGAPHVYFYPLIGPGNAPMTRNWPMKVVEGEERDHKHHRSLWYSHGSVNGVDFWAEGAKSGRIEHEKFLEIKSGADSGVIRSANRWVALDGKVQLTDECVFRVYNRPASERLFDFEITLKAGDGDVVLGDTKEGTMAIRLNENMRLTRGKNTPGQGRIVQSTDVWDGKTWGKRAAWCDYYGPVDGKTVGVAIFDHPSNPRHPTHWHVRDYGLFAANPFGVRDFERDKTKNGEMKLAKGGAVRFRYRLIIHPGDSTEAKIADEFKKYAKVK